jgi:hypothetical protein
VEILTTVLELLGLALILAGIWLVFGLAPAIIVAGVAAIGVSYLIKRGGKRP